MRNQFTILLLAAAGGMSFNTQQSQGAVGIEAAQRGGVVVVCRHSITDPADENEQTLKYDDPSTQRRLSAAGERQATDLGRAFRALRIPVGEVITSPMQRARRTAELAFDKVRVDSLWHTRGENYGGDKHRRRSEVLGRSSDRRTRVIISHIGTIYSNLPSISGELNEGDCVVVRPLGGTRYDVIEVVPWRSWMRAARIEWTLGPFVKPAQVNPVITPSPASRFRSPVNDSIVAWEEYATFNPAAVVRNEKVYLLYRAEDASGKLEIGGHTSRLGLAESSDGLHFTRRGAPVLYPDNDAQRQYEWPGGVEDPRIVETEDGGYVLTYTQWNRDVPRLAVATSRDLVSWTKHGPAFARAAAGKYARFESKSGAILSRMEGDRIIATQVAGKYWMYFGVPDLLIATSNNLLDWTPLENADGRLVKVLSPRPGYFDSWLVEGGPPALLTAHGIVVLYNAGNSGTYGDSALPARVYTGGQALFDARNPVKLLARSEAPFITPTESYERTGQYPEGTTFVEGLVRLRGRWFLYYGTADSRVGVAVWDPQR
jgi:predicted GH43/DUF377 family glycosyl hydrolase/phosphohistidine phosphatase SixA